MLRKYSNTRKLKQRSISPVQVGSGGLYSEATLDTQALQTVYLFCWRFFWARPHIWDQNIG